MLANDRIDADECVLFTDGAGAPGWRVERVTAIDRPEIESRRVKTLALELVDADVVLWLDGRIGMTGAPLRPTLALALDEADAGERRRRDRPRQPPRRSSAGSSPFSV